MDQSGRRIKIVTDSMAALPLSWVEQLRVRVVPLHVLFKDRSYRDGIDVTHDAFMRMMREGFDEGVLPRTSHPSPADFVAVYEEVARQGETEAILSIHASSEISATYQSAVMAARQFEQVPVRVVDTRQVSMGEGLMVREAVRAVDAGAPLDAVVRRIEALGRRMRIHFTVATLDYLWKNGRIGRATAFVGGILQLKPVMAFEDGVVTPVERVRGRARSLERIAEIVAEQTGGHGDSLSIVHADAADDAEAFKEQILQRARFEEVMVTTLGATIGSHAGPGALGAIYVLREGA
ncbi:MAG: DegV family protein [Firmicutes bacterium]|nr:DegV family protein [Bacillota bacterium]